MPIPSIAKGGPWNIHGLSKQNISSDGTQVKIVLDANKHGASSGGSFHASPRGLPARSATLSFSVYLPPDFPVTKSGGKLPGLCVGTAPKGNSSCATGGEWKPDAGSMRFMFRQGKPGYVQAILYVYMPWAEGASSAEKNQKSMQGQGPEYKRAGKGNPPQKAAGHALFLERKNPAKNSWKLKVGEWNDMSMTLTLNSSAGASDGEISGTVNGVTRTISKVRFTTHESAKISNVDFVAFVGGGSSSWDFDRPSYLGFKNLRFAASP